MNTTQTFDKSITIVGAGLVGSLLSIYLGQRGYRVTVYEKLPDIRKEAISAGRSINLALANRGIRPLQQVGIMDEVARLLIPMKGRMLHDIEGQLQFQSYGSKAEEEIYSVSRAGLVSLLRDKAEATGNVTFHFKHKVDAIDFDAQELALVDEHGNNSQQSYDILLGADGAGSKVRRLLESQGKGVFSSELLEHNYKELTIPAGTQGSYQIEKEALHIWPRGGYMLIALPNLDGSFTVTLFMPKHGENSFEQLTDSAQVQQFFDRHFADAAALIPELTQEFAENPVGILGTVRSQNWHYKNAMILGDAAHAIVPFHGQGMNCGFEDCAELHRLLNQHADNWEAVMPAFQEARKANANAIADMALDNYIEMRDSVRDPKFHLKKHIAFRLERDYPEHFIPRYSMVMFHHMPYAMAQERGAIQATILEQLAADHQDIESVDFSSVQDLIARHLPKIPLEYLQ